MKNLKLFCCGSCGEVVATYGNAEIKCCGNELKPIKIEPAGIDDVPEISEMDGDYVLEYHHVMTKEDYIVAVVAELYDRMEMIRLFPEQESLVRLSQDVGGKMYSIGEDGKPQLRLKGCRLYTVYCKEGNVRATLLKG